MIRILPPTEESYGQAESLLRAGEVIGFPTETYYGLAADPRNEQAIARLFALKGRPENAPIPLIAADRLAAARLAALPTLSGAAAVLANRFWPGPLTLVLPAAPDLPFSITAGTRTIGVRVSPHPVAARLAALLGAITSTSANRSGRPPLTTAGEVAAELPELALILDGGPTPGGAPSTVVDPGRDPARILRPGAISRAVLEETGLGFEPPRATV